MSLTSLSTRFAKNQPWSVSIFDYNESSNYTVQYGYINHHNILLRPPSTATCGDIRFFALQTNWVADLLIQKNQDSCTAALEATDILMILSLLFANPLEDSISWSNKTSVLHPKKENQPFSRNFWCHYLQNQPFSRAFFPGFLGGASRGSPGSCVLLFASLRSPRLEPLRGSRETRLDRSMAIASGARRRLRSTWMVMKIMIGKLANIYNMCIYIYI